MRVQSGFEGICSAGSPDIMATTTVSTSIDTIQEMMLLYLLDSGLKLLEVKLSSFAREMPDHKEW